jgi:5-(carboxyamino)imidazole ribonucleotide mutase
MHGATSNPSSKPIVPFLLIYWLELMRRRNLCPFRVGRHSRMSIPSPSPLVAIVMGSDSDLGCMSSCEAVLRDFDVPFETAVVSAHRSPERMVVWAQDAARRGFRVVIAGAGGAAHLPGMISSLTLLPVLGVPIESRALRGLDSLLSIAQMPAGVPTATFAIGDAGAVNAALFAVRILALEDPALAERLTRHREDLTNKAQAGHARVAARAMTATAAP